MQRDYAHEITVDLPPDEALPLFTPKGEEDWVPGWQPAYFRPPTGETCQGMVFTTEHDGETTVWTCVAWQPDRGHARYFRVTPGSRVTRPSVSGSGGPPASALPTSRTVAIYRWNVLEGDASEWRSFRLEHRDVLVFDWSVETR